MATYPIKMLKDENGTPFVPLISLDSVQDTEGKSINEILDKKLETTNIIAGTQIELEVDGNNIKISNSAEGTKLIDNLESAQAGVGALDAHQGKVLLEKIPAIANNLNTPESGQALSAYQGYVLAGRVAPVGGATGQVLKKASDSDYSFEWGDAADPNAIVGDGSIMKIIELTYEEYLELEAANQLQNDTEYHISNWSENNNLRYTEEEVQEMIDKAVANALNENTRSAIMVSVGSNKTLNCETAWGTTVIPWDFVKYNVGDKFTLLENGRIKYTGNKPVKLTIHLQYSVDDACGSVYPIVSSSTYYQEYCSPDHIFATVVGIEQGAPGREFYGAVRTSGTGKKYVYTGNNGASPYNYFMVEEL